MMVTVTVKHLSGNSNQTPLHGTYLHLDGNISGHCTAHITVDFKCSVMINRHSWCLLGGAGKRARQSSLQLLGTKAKLTFDKGGSLLCAFIVFPSQRCQFWLLWCLQRKIKYSFWKVVTQHKDRSEMTVLTWGKEAAFLH